VSKEFTRPQGLLHLFEEQFNDPTRLVQVTDTGRSPLKVIGEEGHLVLLDCDCFSSDLIDTRGEGREKERMNTPT